MQLLMCKNNISPLKAIYNIYVKNKLQQLKKVKLWRLQWQIDLLMTPHRRLHSSPAFSSYMSGTKKKKQALESPVADRYISTRGRYLSQYVHKGQIANLFVEDDVDKGVVHCRGFWKTGRYGRQSQVKWCPTIIDGPQSKNGVRQPAHQEAKYHDHDHPGHLLLCLLGGRRLSLGLRCLQRKLGQDKS